MPKCQHSQDAPRNKTKFSCETLTNEDVLRFSEAFYFNSTKKSQDDFLIKHVVLRTVKKKAKNAKKIKKFSVSYFVRKNSKDTVKVCKPAFLGILCITNRRLRTICENYHKTGQSLKENRGGDHKSFKNSEKKEAVMNHIKSFKVLEEHYCREKAAGKNTHRQYLKSELSVRKMHEMYNVNYPQKSVNLQFYRRIFNSQFNLGFGIPATDVCSTCLSLKEKIKKFPTSKLLEKYPEKALEKQNLIEEYREHKIEAGFFFRLLKEKSRELLTISFDCQKNLVLPKVPDQSAYYSRQIHLHGFGVVVGSSKDKLTRNNVTMYHWTEDKYPKGSSEIASAVYHKLCQIKYSGVRKLRLVCDGCKGQNKNSIILGMLQYWLLVKAPKTIKEIEIIFPVTGHSFMPADRVFGQIEKRVRKLETIVQPEEYINVYSEFATTVEVGSESCPVFEFKKNFVPILKNTSAWHFKISECKKVFIVRDKNSAIVRGEYSFRREISSFKSIIKRGKNISAMVLDRKLSGRKLKSAKIEDVGKLLNTHFGDDWKEDNSLEFYKNLIESNGSQLDDGQTDNMCD
jgi:hypothetical protein